MHNQVPIITCTKSAEEIINNDPYSAGVWPLCMWDIQGICLSAGMSPLASRLYIISWNGQQLSWCGDTLNKSCLLILHPPFLPSSLSLPPSPFFSFLLSLPLSFPLSLPPTLPPFHPPSKNPPSHPLVQWCCSRRRGERGGGGGVMLQPSQISPPS